MSIGFCLWQTGAAQWLAIQWLNLLPTNSAFLFVVGVAFFVMIMTNLIMNVAAIAISLPVALAIAPYLDVAPEGHPVSRRWPLQVCRSCRSSALRLTRSPTRANSSRRRSFFRAGVPASVILMIVIALFVGLVWPWMGMPV